MFKKGDIIEAENRAIDAGLHYIVYYSGFDDKNFIGGMLTHTFSNKNKQMHVSHFHATNENGAKYKFQFENTHLVIAKLMKVESWGPFKKVGALTEEGITFVTETIDKLSSETWEEYLLRTSNSRH